MSHAVLDIKYPGIFTTVQDRGRYGFQRYGVPVSGAMDQFALRVANLLVGNDEGAACLEMTVVGPTMHLAANAVIAVTGADLTPTMDGQPLQMWEAVSVDSGTELSFPDMRDGTRSYLAIAGGIDVPEVLGSRATYINAALGGLNGRALVQDDIISTFDAPEPTIRTMPLDFNTPTYGRHHKLRVIMGPQDDGFPQDAIAILLGSEYTVSLDSDRMGYRLEGPTITHKTGADIVSDGSPIGAIQIPGDGVPTVLLSDRGTTGGYAKIATVISTDVDNLAQALPGHTITFEVVNLESAHQAIRERESVISVLSGVSPISVSVEGTSFEVIDTEGNIVSGLSSLHKDVRTTRNITSANIYEHTYELEVEVKSDSGSGTMHA